MAVVTMPAATDELKAAWNAFQNQLRVLTYLPEDENLGIVMFIEGGDGDPARIAELEAQVDALASASATAVERIAELEAQILTLTTERDGAIERIAKLEEWIAAVPRQLVS